TFWDRLTTWPVLPRMLLDVDGVAIRWRPHEPDLHRGHRSRNLGRKDPAARHLDEPCRRHRADSGRCRNLGDPGPERRCLNGSRQWTTPAALEACKAALAVARPVTLTCVNQSATRPLRRSRRSNRFSVSAISSFSTAAVSAELAVRKPKRSRRRKKR